MFTIVIDLFRDKATSGWAKAIWFVFLLVLPVLTALIYLVARGGGMARRSVAEAQAAKEASDAYIRAVSGTGLADQIEKAKALLDSGVISEAEYATLKAKALA